MQKLTTPCCCMCTDGISLAETLAAPAACKALPDCSSCHVDSTSNIGCHQCHAAAGTNETAAQMYGVAPSSLGPQENDINQEGTDTTLPTSLTAERKANAERHPAPPVEEEAPAAGNSTGSNTTAAGNATAGPPASAADLTGLNDIATTIGSNAAAG